MRQYGPLVLGFLFLVGPPLRAEPPKEKVVEDVWEAAHLEGARVGFFRTTVRELETKSGKVLRTTMQMELSFKRGRAVSKVKAETGTEETADGKVVGVSMKLAQDKGELVLTGTVEEAGLHVTVDGGRIDKVVKWNDEVIGLYRQEHIFKDKKVKPGDKFSYLSYEPTVNTVVTIRCKVGDEEEVPTPAGKKKLLRVEASIDKVKAGENSVQLPGMVLWLDKDRMPVRRQTEVPGLGTIILSRTTREAATAATGPLPKEVDILAKTLIPLNRAIPNPHATKAVVYRITVKDDDDPKTALATDARQEVKNLKGQTFELHVKAVRSPRKVEDPDAAAKKEFTESCYYLKSDDERVKELAARAVGREADPLKKARLVEGWVHDHMKIDDGAAFAPADQIAKTLTGDCRQHAMLAAAMCRAAGVPSRTALGLVYASSRGRPVMAFHMWTEVWVKGQWLAIDATLGQGSIGAAHVKIADHSWHDTQSLTPMLPVARVLGKLKIEVVSVNEAE